MFDFGSVRVGFILHKVALRQVFLGIFWITAGFIIRLVLRIHSSVTDTVQLAITRAQRERERERERERDIQTEIIVYWFCSSFLQE